MPIVRVRVWLDDRPGALGAVTSRIGAVKGDVIGVEILERGGGRAIDDLVVSLPDDVPTPLLVSQINEVDGADVEEITAVDASQVDLDLAALEASAGIVALGNPDRVVTTVADRSAHACSAAWSAVVDTDGGTVTYRTGSTPKDEWLVAFVRGTQSSDLMVGADGGPDDVVWAPLGSFAIVIGREHQPFRSRERRRFLALVRISDARLRQLR
jgi:hypothetical protein